MTTLEEFLEIDKLIVKWRELESELSRTDEHDVRLDVIMDEMDLIWRKLPRHVRKLIDPAGDH